MSLRYKRRQKNTMYQNRWNNFVYVLCTDIIPRTIDLFDFGVWNLDFLILELDFGF